MKEDLTELLRQRGIVEPEPQKKTRRKPRHPESSLQQRCVRWFRAWYKEYALLFFSVPNGGLRGKREAEIMKAEGIVSGVSDTILLVSRQGYNCLCIEFKSSVTKGRQSEEQKAWQAAAEREGNRYVVIDRQEDFQDLIRDYLGRRD